MIELFRGEVAWDGVVEAFDLEGHPKAKRCYAWVSEENGEPKYTTVLEIPPSIRRRAPSKWRLQAKRGKIELTKMLFPDQNHSRRNIYAADENARGSNRSPTASWRMEALRCLRG